MGNLIRAFAFKLRKDWTFRITLFIGLGLALMISLIYFVLDKNVFASEESAAGTLCTGQNLLMSSVNPGQNFGIAVPVNLITFTVLEFNYGTIRNKIIAGNSKAKVYFGLLISGFCFTMLLMVAYIGLSTLLGTIFGGFDINGNVASLTGAGGTFNAEFLVKLLVLTVFAYAFITALTIFFATLFRSIGPCISVVLLIVLGFVLIASILGSAAKLTPDLKTADDVLRVVDPFYFLVNTDVVDGKLTISNQSFFTELGNNVIYAAAFVVGGFLLFRKRDVK